MDILIGATSGSPVITKKDVLKFKKNLLILDIGKGIFFKDALKLAISNKYVLYRLDVTPAYNSYLENILSTKKLNFEDNVKIEYLNNITYNSLCLYLLKGIMEGEYN